MARYRFVVACVFTDTPLSGNQLAVFTNARDLPEGRLQELAREMNFSETVFVYPSEVAHARIRIFTPAAEVPFAGHPTLGSAFVLAGPLQLDEITLETGREVVPVRLEREGARIVFGRMEQPIPTVEPYADADGPLAAVRVEQSERPGSSPPSAWRGGSCRSSSTTTACRTSTSCSRRSRTWPSCDPT